MLNDCSRHSMREIWEDDRKAASEADIISAWHRVHPANQNGDIRIRTIWFDDSTGRFGLFLG